MRGKGCVSRTRNTATNNEQITGGKMDAKKKIVVQYWLESSEDDWKVANHVLKKGIIHIRYSLGI
ncbi:MAG: hypothetical protein FJY07_09495 [Bacteroidetes bacterium]|nr:hypothetical protein [Bacteroidota bacterium]